MADFPRLEMRSGIAVVVYEKGCAPATATEKLLFKRLAQMQPFLEACETTFNLCQGLERHSVSESDRYWELAEDLMELTSKRLKEKIIRIDPDKPKRKAKKKR